MPNSRDWEILASASHPEKEVMPALRNKRLTGQSVLVVSAAAQPQVLVLEIVLLN